MKRLSTHGSQMASLIIELNGKLGLRAGLSTGSGVFFGGQSLNRSNKNHTTPFQSQQFSTFCQRQERSKTKAFVGWKPVKNAKRHDSHKASPPVPLSCSIPAAVQAESRTYAEKKLDEVMVRIEALTEKMDRLRERRLYLLDKEEAGPLTKREQAELDEYNEMKETIGKEEEEKQIWLKKVNSSETTMKWPIANDAEIQAILKEHLSPISPSLVQTEGSVFKFLDREESFSLLASSTAKRFKSWKLKDRDRNLHPIPFLADGPGTGKSRFLQELPLSFKSFVDKANLPNDFKDCLSKTLFINITFGNGSPYLETEIATGIETSVCLRILHEFNLTTFPSFKVFESAMKERKLDLALASTLARICPPDIECVVLGIDEVNRVHAKNTNGFKELFSILGGLSCSSGKQLFVPVLAGTVIGPIQSVVTESTHPPLHIPLPLLSFESCVSIFVECNQQLPADARSNKHLRQLIFDVGGHCRSLEFLYNALTSKMSNPRLLSYWDDIAAEVRSEITKRYKICQLPNIEQAIAYSFLSIPVDQQQLVSGPGSPSFLTMAENGLVKLVPKGDQFVVSIPFMFVSAFLRTHHTNPYAKFWNELPLANVLYWEQWEDFNVTYMAFRLSLFSCLGISSIPLAKLLQGANLNLANDHTVCIPPIENIKVTRLSQRYPETKRPEFSSGNCVLNAGGSSFDGFVYLDIQEDLTLQQPGNRCLIAMQMKLKRNTDRKMTTEVITAEYKKTQSRIKKHLAGTKFILLVLGRSMGNYEGKRMRKNCAVVSEREQEEFYGEAYHRRFNLNLREK
ncbi:hypothetical protein BDR26DRAFT_863244 [Obelidium mucronatum]|nr:hypothetical protein BDR26DRAFT_863244 [Obelidium mucronatum]